MAFNRYSKFDRGLKRTNQSDNKKPPFGGFLFKWIIHEYFLYLRELI